VRALVVIAVLSGFVPNLRAEAPTYAGIVSDGAAVAPADGHGQTHPEHGCDVTMHLCGCCASQPLIVRASISLPVELAPAGGLATGEIRRPAFRVAEPPFRPPIA